MGEPTRFPNTVSAAGSLCEHRYSPGIGETMQGHIGIGAGRHHFRLSATDQAVPPLKRYVKLAGHVRLDPFNGPVRQLETGWRGRLQAHTETMRTRRNFDEWAVAFPASISMISERVCARGQGRVILGEAEGLTHRSDRAAS